MITNLTYNDFSQQPVSNRIDWIDTIDLLQLKADYTPLSIKQFFRQLFEGETNSYIQLKALEAISELTLLNVIRYDFTKDFLLEEASMTGNVFIDTARLKYLFLLYGDDQECYSVFANLAQVEHPEVAAEACYRTGLTHLLYRTDQKSFDNILQELLTAKQWFDAAQQNIENRTDARFFDLTSQYLLSLLSLEPELADNLFDELNQVLWERQLQGYLSGTNLLEYRVYLSLTNLRSIATFISQEEYWTEYKKEFLLLSNCFNEIILAESLSDRFTTSLKAFNHNPLSFILDSYYAHNLSARYTKIAALLAQADPDETILIDFLTDLQVRLSSYQEKKKDKQIDIVASLCSAFPNVSPAVIVTDVRQLNNNSISDTDLRFTLAIRYAGHSRVDLTSFVTGYKITDEILIRTLSRLKEILPAYSQREFAIFSNVFSDLLRYTYQAETQPREFFPHLYDATVTAEEIFQRHLFTRLTAGERATNYHFEIADVVGASRLDIMYREDNAVFPIEVKKTKSVPTWESVKQNYAAQVQMYNRPYNQLGFLIVFDISPKKGAAPLNNFRSLVDIIHIAPYYSIKDINPDYVIAIIVPSNKIRPSDYTSYR